MKSIFALFISMFFLQSLSAVGFDKVPNRCQPMSYLGLGMMHEEWITIESLEYDFDGYFVFSLKADEEMEVKMGFYDEEGYELVSFRVSLLRGNNYKAIDLSHLHAKGEYTLIITNGDFEMQRQFSFGE